MILQHFAIGDGVQMFFKPGAFIGAAGRSMAFIQSGRNRDRDHAFLPQPRSIIPILAFSRSSQNSQSGLLVIVP